MIGNDVRVILKGIGQDRTMTVRGELRAIDVTGVHVYVHDGLPEAHGLRFFPAWRVVEVVDLGYRGPM
jgi:hypothetical protein